jgi:hypothetical protein
MLAITFGTSRARQGRPLQQPGFPFRDGTEPRWLAENSVRFGDKDMRHKLTRQTLSVWRRQKGSAAALDRSRFDPTELGPLMRDIFLLERAKDHEYRFRIAGAGLCVLFGGELRGESFLSALTHGSIEDARDILAAVTEDLAPVVAGATALVRDGHELEAELLLLPMAHEGRTDLRVLGSLSLVVPDRYLLGECRGLDVISFRTIGEGDMRLLTAGESVSLPAGQVRRGPFIVHQGGQGAAARVEPGNSDYA